MSADPAPNRVAADTEPLDEELRVEQLVAPRGNKLVFFYRDTIEIAPLNRARSLVLGRLEPASVVVPDPKLSREHARFSARGEQVVVEDLASLNGVWLRGERVAQAVLSAGEEVVVGNTVVRLRGAEPSPPSRAAAAYLEGPAMRALVAEAQRAANSKLSVVLHGETGSGKEVIARLLHEGSPRRDQPLLQLNCAAIPVQLVEGLLFGHERGAYTGAHQRQRGIFEEAHGGTVFLDEVGELSPAAQASLLRVLETGTFTRVGSPQPLSVDVRVVAASHRSLETMVEAGLFRADLYYRLNGLTLQLPALRDRVSDIEPIARRLLARAADASGRALRGISIDTLEALERAAWPGNVRELKNTIDQMVVLTRDDVLLPSHLPRYLRDVDCTGEGRPSPAPSASDVPTAGETLDADGLRRRVTHYESKLIVEALRAAHGNKTEAARLLQMPIRTLSRRIKQLRIVEAPGES